MKNLTLMLVALTFFLSLLHGHAHAFEESYSVEIRNAPIADVIRMLAQMQEKNIVIPEGLDGKVTASFPSILLHDALTSVLESNNLGAIGDDNIIRIASRQTLQDLGADLTTTTFRLKYAKAKEIEPQVKALVSNRGSVVVDTRTNAITIRDSTINLDGASAFIENIDKLDQQVLIEARVVEASDTFVRNLGIQWGVSGSAGPFSIRGLRAGAPATGAGTGTGTSAGTASASAGAPGTAGTTGTTGTSGTSGSAPSYMVNTPPASALAGVGIGLGPFSGFSIDAQLSMAETNGEVSILSRPSIVTMNNQPATISSGSKFYVKTGANLSFGGGGGAGAPGGGLASGGLQQISAGLTLEVTPQITADNEIKLVISVTESKPDYSNTVDGIPGIVDNTATTVVRLKDGESTVIGGLLRFEKSNSQGGVPLLHRIPILGYLFGSRSKNQSKRELMIFVKPSIVKENMEQMKKWEVRGAQIIHAAGGEVDESAKPKTETK